MAAPGVKTGSPLSVASERLRERKENVVEQLESAEKFVDQLCGQRDCLVCNLDEECSSFENEVNVLKKVLEVKRVALIEELQARRKDELEALSSSIELASAAISKTNEVRKTGK